MLRAAALVALALFAANAVARDALIPLGIGKHAFKVEVASTPAERTRGLMGRTRLPAAGGMLFVFEEADRHCFWMRNTPLPLSIAFIDDSTHIIALADMAPLSDALHCPPSDIRYALEVEQGEFAVRGIMPGARIKGLPR